MTDNRTRTHFYHADANAIGGRIERPFDQIVPLQVPLSLSPVGGYAVAHSEQFQFEGILSVESATTQVAGSYNEKNGSWATLASAAVEGLNVLNVITADRVVAQISTEHPREGYTPKVSFIGTQFVNLRINGRLIEPVLDLGFCDQGDPTDYPEQPCIDNLDFLKKVDNLHRRMRSASEDAATASRNDTREWLQQRYPVSKSETGAQATQAQKRGMVLCSLVQEIQGEYDGKRLGHVLVIPEFGKVFLGELLLDHNSFQLIMVRLELGCPVQGTASATTIRTNGSSYP